MLGKTYTLLGPGLHCAYSESEHGIIPRFIREIFHRLAQHHDRNTNINITWTQICGENIQDLLGNGSVEVCNVSDAFHWLQLGMSNMAPNHAHTLFTLTIEQQWVVESTIEHRISTASFADLTSCEKILIMDNLGEARSVPTDNGLLTLHNVITTITDPFYGYQNCVPYNQSTLTTLLKDSFGGRAKTLVICCVSPLVRDFSETLYTLQLSVKIQCVRNYVTTNSYTNTCAETIENLGSEQESVDRSTYGDMFGLQFAVSQWMKLVSNAEDLFNKLIINKQVSEPELEQISEWLLLKQECEECLSSEETISIEAMEPQRSLGRIEEETELDNETTTNTTTPPNDLSESETESDMDPQRPDFLDKLDSFMQTFRLDTDHLVSEQYENSLVMDCFPSNKIEFVENRKSCDSLNRSCSPNEQLQAKGARGRRASIHPGDSLLPDILSGEAPVDFMVSSFDKMNIRDLVPLKHAQTDISDPYKQIKTLCVSTEVKQKRIRQVIADLEGAQKQIDELQYTIQIKEQLIENMIKNGDTRSYAKQKFQKKRTKLEGEYYKARTQAAQAESNMLHCHSSDKPKYKEEVEKYKSVAAYYEKRLKDIESIKVITEDSARKLLELENSLHTSRKQMDRLKKQLRKEEKRKQSLEQELLDEKQKIADLELQTNRQGADEEHRSLREVSARISHLDQVLKEKSFDLERAEDFDEKESLRHEIRNLRRTRDCLVEQRCHLDGKLKKEKMLSDSEERKLLECEEAIEAIDAAIEYKNELICGRKHMDNARVEREKGEEMLMQRLMKLSENEMRTLLYKYFQKVIDLRDSSKKLEMQVVQLERECEASVWRIQTLSHLLQQVRLESERRVVLLQQQHEDKLNLMMRHFADETSASSDADRKVDRVMARILERNQVCQVAGSSRHSDQPVVKCKQEGRHARVIEKYTEESRDKNKIIARIQELARYHTEKSRIHTSTIPQQNLKQLQSAGDSPATKVTRQKNKLIIQQSKPRK